MAGSFHCSKCGRAYARAHDKTKHETTCGRTCSHAGCGLPVRQKDLCVSHYRADLYNRKKAAGLTCSFEGCEDAQKAEGLCGKHHHMKRAAEAKAEANPAICSVEGCAGLLHQGKQCRRHYRAELDAKKKADNIVCSREGCDRPQYGLTLCKKHHQQVSRDNQKITYMTKTCTLGDCDKPQHSSRLGLCRKHYDHARAANSMSSTPQEEDLPADKANKEETDVNFARSAQCPQQHEQTIQPVDDAPMLDASDEHNPVVLAEALDSPEATFLDLHNGQSCSVGTYNLLSRVAALAADQMLVITRNDLVEPLEPAMAGTPIMGVQPGAESRGSFKVRVEKLGAPTSTHVQQRSLKRKRSDTEYSNDIAGNDIAGNDIAGNDKAGKDEASNRNTSDDAASDDAANDNTASDDAASDDEAGDDEAGNDLGTKATKYVRRSLSKADENKLMELVDEWRAKQPLRYWSEVVKHFPGFTPQQLQSAVVRMQSKQHAEKIIAPGIEHLTTAVVCSACDYAQTLPRLGRYGSDYSLVPPMTVCENPDCRQFRFMQPQKEHFRDLTGANVDTSKYPSIAHYGDRPATHPSELQVTVCCPECKAQGLDEDPRYHLSSSAYLCKRVRCNKCQGYGYFHPIDERAFKNLNKVREVAKRTIIKFFRNNRSAQVHLTPSTSSPLPDVVVPKDRIEGQPEKAGIESAREPPDAQDLHQSLKLKSPDEIADEHTVEGTTLATDETKEEQYPSIVSKIVNQYVADDDEVDMDSDDLIFENVFS